MATKILKEKKVAQYELPIKIEPDKEGYFALCPIWSDCYAQGETIDEVVSEIIAVAASLIEIYKEEGLKIPLRLKEKAAVLKGE